MALGILSRENLMQHFQSWNDWRRKEKKKKDKFSLFRYQ